MLEGSNHVNHTVMQYKLSILTL